MTETRNTPETAHTHDDGEDRRRQYCKCGQCGHTSVCTPYNDYFTVTKEPPDETGMRRLYCERCFSQRTHTTWMSKPEDN